MVLTFFYIHNASSMAESSWSCISLCSSYAQRGWDASAPPAVVGWSLSVQIWGQEDTFHIAVLCLVFTLKSACERLVCAGEHHHRHGPEKLKTDFMAFKIIVMFHRLHWRSSSQGGKVKHCTALWLNIQKILPKALSVLFVNKEWEGKKETGYTYNSNTQK